MVRRDIPVVSTITSGRKVVQTILTGTNEDLEAPSDGSSVPRTDGTSILSCLRRAGEVKFEEGVGGPRELSGACP